MSISPPSALLNPELWNAAPVLDWDKFYGKKMIYMVYYVRFHLVD
jgi:hypothetical protein